MISRNRSGWWRAGVLVQVLWLAGAAPVQAKPVTPAGPARDDKPKVVSKLTFAATGDMMNHVSVSQSAAAANVKDETGQTKNDLGFDALFTAVVQDVSAADLSFINLETPIAPKASHGVREFVFNSPPELVRALMATGFDVVSFANNHVYDQGRAGFIESLDNLEALKIPFVGAGRTKALAQKGIRLERNGIRVAMLGASQFFNSSESNVADEKQPFCNRTDDPDALEAAVKEARKDADFVIVSTHWGVEYTPKPRESEVALAHRLFDAGADVVLGHHPHVLQPIEIYAAPDGRMCMVVYSMGNFISNQSRQYVWGVSPDKVGDSRDGVLMKFALEKRDYGHGVVKTELADVSYLPLWTDNDYPTRKEKAPPVIRVVVVDRELAALRKQVDSLDAEIPKATGKDAKEKKAELVRVKKRIAMLEHRRELISARLGSDFIEELQP